MWCPRGRNTLGRPLAPQRVPRTVAASAPCTPRPLPPPPQSACYYAYSVASISILLNFLLSLMQASCRGAGEGARRGACTPAGGGGLGRVRLLRDMRHASPPASSAARS
jgi:hypothetical protein